MKRKNILIATLGTEPQVVTSTHFLLDQQGENISEIHVIHTSGKEDPRVKDALIKLNDKCPEYIFHELKNSVGYPISDVDNQEAANSVFLLIYELVQKAKLEDKKVHLCIAGGRKTMTVFGMATAQILFDKNDKLWHLFSSLAFSQSKALYPSKNDQVFLFPIPVIYLSEISPLFDEIKNARTPEIAIEQIQSLELVKRKKMAGTFVNEKLSRAEKEVLQTLIEQDWDMTKTAKVLIKDYRTVETQLKDIRIKAEIHWNLPKVSKHKLTKLVMDYYFFKFP